MSRRAPAGGQQAHLPARFEAGRPAVPGPVWRRHSTSHRAPSLPSLAALIKSLVDSVQQSSALECPPPANGDPAGTAPRQCLLKLEGLLISELGATCQVGGGTRAWGAGSPSCVQLRWCTAQRAWLGARLLGRLAKWGLCGAATRPFAMPSPREEQNHSLVAAGGCPPFRCAILCHCHRRGPSPLLLPT